MTLDDLIPALLYCNLTVRQLAILLIMSQSPENLMCKEMAFRLRVSRSVISRAWDSLSNLGFIKRVRDEGDRRNVWAVLTPKGEKFMGEMK